MLLQVTPIVVTAPVMTLGTTMTHQFTSTAAPYPGGGHGMAATRMPRVQGAQLPTRQPGLFPVRAASRQLPDRRRVAAVPQHHVGRHARCRPSGLSMPRPRMYALRVAQVAQRGDCDRSSGALIGGAPPIPDPPPVHSTELDW